MKKCLLQRTASLFLILFLIQISCSEIDYPIKKTIENDIEIWLNPEYPKYSDESISMNELLSIGVAEGDTNYMFNYLCDLNVDENENIYSLDYSDYKVRVYNKDGIFLYSFGRKGQGPGEFIEPTRIFLNSQSQILIFDSKNERLTFFSKDGKYLSDFKTGDYSKSSKLIGIDLKDELYVTFRLSWDYATGQEKRSFVRLDKKGKELNTIFTLTGQNGTKNTLTGGFWNTGYEHGAINYSASPDGDLIVGKSSEYLFSVYDKFGKLTKKFGRKYKTINMSNEDKRRLSKDEKKWSLLPSKKPAFKISYFRFFVDDKNNFWVRTFERENEATTFDIFNQEGIYIKKLYLEHYERNLKPILFKNNMLYAIHIDIDGVNRINKYKIIF